MAATSVLKKQVKKFIDKASEKELRMIYSLFEINKDEDWWGMISKEQQKAVKDAIEEANKGQVIPHSEMVKKYSKWLRK
jgi:predicted transcriptional regulator